MSISVRSNLALMIAFLHLTCVSQSADQVRRLQSNPNATYRQTEADKIQENRRQVETVKLYPSDQGAQDPSFADFRNKLLRAAERQDISFVLSIVDPNVVNGSDLQRGLKEFEKQWHLGRSNSRLWQTLKNILVMGGSFRSGPEGREFCAPYVTSEWPQVVTQLPKGADPLDYQLITADNVQLRSQPSPNAPVVTTLSYDVVKVLPDGSVFRPNNNGGTTWLKIATQNGNEGYVADKNIRGASDYHACFAERIGKRWVMTELAAIE